MRRGLTQTTGYILLLLIGLSVLASVGLFLTNHSPRVKPNILEVGYVSVERVDDMYRLNMLITAQGGAPMGIIYINIWSENLSKVVSYGDGGLFDQLYNYTDSLSETTRIVPPNSFSEIIDWLIQFFHPRIVLTPGATVAINELHQVPENLTLGHRVIVEILYVDAEGNYRLWTKIVNVNEYTTEKTKVLPPPPPSPPWEHFNWITLKVTITRKHVIYYGTSVVAIPLTSSVVPELFANSSLIHTLYITWGNKTLEYSVLYMDDNKAYILIPLGDNYFERNVQAVINITITGKPTGYETTKPFLGIEFADGAQQEIVYRYSRVWYSAIYPYIWAYAYQSYKTVRLKYLSGYTLPVSAIKLLHYYDGINMTFETFVKTLDGNYYKFVISGCVPGPELKIYRYYNGNWQYIVGKELGCGRVKYIGISYGSHDLGYTNYVFQVNAPIAWIRAGPSDGLYAWGRLFLYVYADVPSSAQPTTGTTILLFQNYLLDITVERVEG